MANRKIQVSPEIALASDIFDKFCGATTLKTILGNYRYLCDILHLKPTNFPQFYPKLKSNLCSWRAQALWNKFDKRANHKCYNQGKGCSNTRVLIIGAGPCGLRTAIEAQLLGAKVVIIEKRDRMTRNNVLHLWPFVIQDLRALGAKKFFGKFCAGSIDHISIRQLQCILLKVVLLLGVEIHEGVGFESLLQPPTDQSEEKIGWRARVSPADHPVSQYEFDVLIGADGKRNTLEGFKRKEFRGKLAIAITANFINHRSEAEARVEEISGVAYIFNQKFFKDLYSVTGIDLENIVYYKDETHYFVMTAKKHSLLNKGVILNDYADTAKLLALENVNKDALMEYALEAADFSTNYKLPQLQFAVNHYGQPDVAMFDFTSMYAAENASRVIQLAGYKLLMCLVGDSLLEPFWPTGSGCARGFLSSMDACWAVRSWGISNNTNPLEVIAERESIYRLLAQTTPENLNRDTANYALDPHTRYPNLNSHCVLPIQVVPLYSVDDSSVIEQCLKTPSSVTDFPKKRKKKETHIHQSTLLLWLKRQVVLYNNIYIEDTNKSFKDGLALCAIIHRYRPDLIDFNSLRPENVASNNQLAFDILEKEYGILPVMTGSEMQQCEIPDNLAMLSYLTQVYDTFRGEIPFIRNPKMEEDLKSIIESDPKASSTYSRNLSKLTYSQKLSLLSKLSGSLSRKRHHESRQSGASSKMVDTPTSRRPRKRRSNASSFIEERKNNFELKPRNQTEKVEMKCRKEHRLSEMMKRTLEGKPETNQVNDSVELKSAKNRLINSRIAKCVEKLQENENPNYNKAKNVLPFHEAKYRSNRELNKHLIKNIETITQNRESECNSKSHSVRHGMRIRNDQKLNARILTGIQLLQQNGRKESDSNENIPFDDYSVFVYRQSAPEFKERVKDLEKKLLYPDREVKELQEKRKSPLEEDFSGRVKDIENKLKGSYKKDKKPHDLYRAIGKLEKTDWNVKEIEKKIEENKYGRGYTSKVERVPRWNRQQFDDKFSAVKQKLIDKNSHQQLPSKYMEIDNSLKKLDQKLRNPGILEQGQRGANKVSAMAAQLTVMNKVPDDRSVSPKSSSPVPLVVTPQGGSEICNFCKKRVYLMERLSAEGKFFHRGCFRCEYCSISLRLGNYAYDRDGRYGNRFYCIQHYGLPGTLKMKLRNRNEQYQRVVNDPKEPSDNVLLKSPIAEEVVFNMDATDTPERVEFENLDVVGEESGNISRNEMDEDEWTDHNFGTSANELASSDDLSDFSESDDENNDGFAQALDIQQDTEPLQLSEQFSHKYPQCSDQGRTFKMDAAEGVPYGKLHSTPRSDSSSSNESEAEAYHEFDSDDDDDSDTATECEKDIKAREMRMQEVRLEVPDRIAVSDSDSGSDTEVLSDDEDDTDEDSDEDGCTLSIDSDNSATEISTDSEFERNGASALTSDIPNIVITGSAPVKKDYLEEVRKVQIVNKKSAINIDRKNAVPVLNEFTLSNNESKIVKVSPLLNPRKGDYFLNRTQSTEGIASKLSLELKKKYLLGATDYSNPVKKSESTSVLDTRFKNLVDQISEHQKLLNPAPEPSLSMQTFLETTNKLRSTSPASSMMNKKVKELDQSNEFHHICKKAENGVTNEDNDDEQNPNFDIKNVRILMNPNFTGYEILEQMNNDQRMVQSENKKTICSISAPPSDKSSAVSNINNGTTIYVPELPKIVDTATLPVLSDSQTSEDSSTEHENDQEIAFHNIGQISLPKVEIRDVLGKLLPNELENIVDKDNFKVNINNTDIDYNKIGKTDNSQNYSKVSKSASDVILNKKFDNSAMITNSINKIISVPITEHTNRNKEGEILRHVSSTADLFFSADIKGFSNELNVSNSDKSNSSTPTGDESTLATLTETELSDWARDDDGVVSENLDDFSLLNTKNITYRKHQKPTKLKYSKRGMMSSKVTSPDDKKDYFAHVCGKDDGEKLGSLNLSNIDFEYMDTLNDADDDTKSDEDGNNRLDRILLENSGYIEYVTSDEAKTPPFQTTNDLHLPLDFYNNKQNVRTNFRTKNHNDNLITKKSIEEFPISTEILNIDYLKKNDIKNCPPPTAIEYNKDYEKFVHRLQDRISPFSNVKDSIDIRKAKKNNEMKETIVNDPQNFEIVDTPLITRRTDSSSKKLEALSREKSIQKNLVHEMVMSKVQSDRRMRKGLKECDKVESLPSENLSKNLLNDEKVMDLSELRTASLDEPVLPITKNDSTKCLESFSLPDIRKALLETDDKLLLTPVQENFSKNDIVKLTESIKEKARARARLMTHSELGLSPEEKLQLLKERLLPRNRVKSVYESFSKNEMSDDEDANDVALTLKCTDSDTTEKRLLNRGDKERRKKSIIQAVSDFFYKKSPPSPTNSASQSTSSHSPNKSRFKIPLKGRDKSKEKRLSGSETSVKPSPEKVEENLESKLQPYDEGNTIKKSEENISEVNDLSTVSCDDADGQSTLSSRQNRTSKRLTKQAHSKRLRIAQEIQRELEEIEVKQKELESRGVNVEKALRGEDEKNTKGESELTQELLELMQERNELQRYERKLLARAQEIEQEDRNARHQ